MEAHLRQTMCASLSLVTHRQNIDFQLTLTDDRINSGRAKKDGKSVRDRER